MGTIDSAKISSPKNDDSIAEQQVMSVKTKSKKGKGKYESLKKSAIVSTDTSS